MRLDHLLSREIRDSMNVDTSWLLGILECGVLRIPTPGSNHPTDIARYSTLKDPEAVLIVKTKMAASFHENPFAGSPASVGGDLENCIFKYLSIFSPR